MSMQQPELPPAPATTPAPPASAPLDNAGAQERGMMHGPPTRLPPARGIGGFRPREMVMMAVLAALLVWAAWATAELLALKERRVVSVSLATMVQDFVASEARRGASQQDAAARTKAYLGAIDAAMRAISEDGTTILVSEAVLGNSVPDVTTTVMLAVNRQLGLQPAAAQAPLAGLPPLPAPRLPAPPASVPDVSMADRRGEEADVGAEANPFAGPAQ